MRYLPYSEYQLAKKITWFGTVPKIWQIKRLRFATKGIEQGGAPQCDNRMAEDDAWGVMKVGCVNGIFGKLMSDGEFRRLATEHLLHKVYGALKTGKGLDQPRD